VLAPSQPHLQAPPWRAHWRRIPLAIAAAATVGVGDIGWKAATLASGQGAATLDAPSSLLRPLATLLVGALALSGVLVLPRLCVPGVLLVVGGVSSNVVSLVLWRAVPNPIGVAVAGGMLRCNLADLCIWGGGLIFLAAAFWTIWRLPAERFA
jgi:hypothetical protein